MAQRILTIETDLNKTLKVVQLPGIMASGDRYGDIIRVLAFRGKEPVTLTGTITGYVIDSAGNTFGGIVGTASGNGAQIQLPQEAYQLPGQIQIAIRETVGEVKTTLCVAVSSIVMTQTGQTYDPGDIMPSVDDILEYIRAAEEATDAANQAAAFYPMVYDGVLTFPARKKEYYAIGGDNGWVAGQVIADKISGNNYHYVLELGGLVEGETFTIKAHNGMTARPWGIIDKNRAAMIWSPDDDAANDLVTVPEGGTGGTLIVQVGNSSISSANVIRHRNLTSVEGKIDGFDDALYQIAVPFDDSTAYVAGQMVYYNNLLYRFTTNHAAGAWTGTDVAQVILSDEVGGIKSDVNELKSQIGDYYVLTLYEANLSSTETVGNVTFSWNGSECTVSGTSDGNERNLVFHNVNNALPGGMQAGGTYYVKYSSTNVYLDVYPYIGNSLGTRLARTKTSTSITLPSGTTGLFLRLHSDYNKTIDETVEPLIRNSENESLPEKLDDLTAEDAVLDTKIGSLTDSLDDLTAADTALDTKIGLRIWPKSASPYVSGGALALGDIREDGRYIIDTSWSISDAPPWSFPNSYVLTVENFYPTPGNNFCRQTVYGLKASGNKKTFCRMRSGGAWNAWIDLSPMYDNVILPTGNTTDRKTEIEAALTNRGGVILAPGDYYVSGITMPDNTSIKGGGMGKTRLFYIAGNTGSCIKMGTQCNVSDLSIYGQNSDAYSEDANRNGLGWVGTYVSDSNPGTYPVQGMASNLYIEGFKGGGIYCTNTSMGSWSGLQAENVTVFKCWAGVYIKKYSEFSQFTNVRANNCTYGCINNGGNNMFVNCNFSKNTTALLMDDTNDQAPNNSHGSFVGCVFDHSGGNEGYAMILTGLDNGEMFTGCQIFYGKTQITGCIGIRFVGCNYGRKTDLQITNSYAVSYDSCQFRAATDTPLTQSGNTGLKFNNCLLYDGTEFNPMGT